MTVSVAFLGGRHPNGVQYGPAKALQQRACGAFGSGP
jgi:hypothetical protein